MCFYQLLVNGAINFVNILNDFPERFVEYFFLFEALVFLLEIVDAAHWFLTDLQVLHADLCEIQTGLHFQDLLVRGEGIVAENTITLGIQGKNMGLE